MPLIKSVFSAIKEVNFIQLKLEHRAIVDGYVKQIMAIQHKAHEPRCFEESVKILHEQLGARLKSLAQMSIGFSPLKAYRRKNAIVKIEARLKCLNECLSGDFAALYQKKKDAFLHFLSAAKLRHFLRPGADFLNTLYELLLNDDPLLITLLENHLEQGVLKDEYSKQFNELILLLRLKASYKPKKTPSHFSDYSLLELEMDIEKQQALALVNGDKALGRALKYLALGCQLTTIKTTALQAAVLEHGVNMQAYRHNQKCRELGGRVVVHCNQILIPGLGLENGFCYGLSYLWAKQLIKSDKFMGFRGNQEAFIQPTSASAGIVKLIPSFNDLVRIDIELFTIQESQELTKLPNYQLIITKFAQEMPEFTQRVLEKASLSSNSVVFSAYYTNEGAHVVGVRKRTTPTPQGYLIDYFDANSGWMQFKDEKSFNAFFIYYLNDRNNKERIKRLALDIVAFPAGYIPIMQGLAKSPAVELRPQPQNVMMPKEKASLQKSNLLPEWPLSEKLEVLPIRRRASL